MSVDHIRTRFGTICNKLTSFVISNERTQNSTISIPTDKTISRFNLNNLRHLNTSPILPGRITAHTASTLFTYVACGNEIVFLKNQGAIYDDSIKCHESSIISMLCIGDQNLLVAHADGTLCLFDEKRLFSTVRIEKPILLIMHPCTYLNKILIVTEDNELLLWNVKLCQLIQKVQLDFSVRCLVQSPVIDIFAIGSDSGFIYIFDLKANSVLFRLCTNRDASITSLNFCKEKIITGDSDGYIDVFDLEKRKHLSSINQQHGIVTTLSEVPGCDLILALFENNAIAHFSLDSLGFLKLYRSRLGNPGPVSLVAFCPESTSLFAFCFSMYYLLFIISNQLVSWTYYNVGMYWARNQYTSTFEEEIESVCISPRRASRFLMPEWADCVLTHKNVNYVSLVRSDGMKNFRRKRYISGDVVEDKMAERFRPEKNFDCNISFDSTVQCCAISHCCNFACISYSSGHLIVFNLQSRLERMRVQTNQSIHALSFDRLNRFILTGSDCGMIECRPFKSKHEKISIKLDSGIHKSFACYNDIFAVPLTNCSISIIRASPSNLSIIRQIPNKHFITCMKFDDSGCFLLCSFVSFELAIFDVKTGLQVSLLKYEQPVLSFDIRDGFIVAACRGQSDLIVSPLRVKNKLHTEYAETSTLKTIEGSSKSIWRQLCQMEVVIKQNKPEPAVDKPKNAPFFLPTVPTLTGFKLVSIEENDSTDKSEKHSFTERTEIDKFLEQNKIDFLLRMSAVRIEYELDNLIAINDQQLLKKFIDVLMKIIEDGTNFDFVAAVSCRLITKCCMEVSLDQNFDELMKLSNLLKRKWSIINQNYSRTKAMIHYLKNDVVCR